MNNHILIPDYPAQGSPEGHHDDIEWVRSPFS